MSKGYGYLEVGPRRAITGFVRNILDQRPHTAIHTNHHKRVTLKVHLMLGRGSCCRWHDFVAGVRHQIESTMRAPAP